MTTAVRPVTSRNTAFHALTVARVEHLCEDAAAITFAVPDELSEEYRFRPGQSLTLRRVIDGRDQRRSYSICAQVGAPLRVGVRVVADGLFSTWLVNDVRPGDTVEVATPAGSFTPDPREGGRHVLIAAGSGITPMISIVSSLLTNPDAQVTLLYGNRRTTTVMFAEDLADLKDSYGSRFELVHVLSREPREVELFSGRLDTERIESILNYLVPVKAVDGFWLCGPFDLVESARTLLVRLGVPAQKMHAELFYVEDVAPVPARHVEGTFSGPASSVTVILDGRSTQLRLPKDHPLLDSAQQSRSDLPFACKGGVCGTCRAKVISGDVEMRRNYALEAHEVAAGFVLTCQSYPLSDEVIVDYDS
jgi:ring-1,2-phenylacetyl-CoA epoxidase subunit PaaE